MAHVYRIDEKNVGDFVCPPHLYFPFASQPVYDIRRGDIDVTNEKAVIVGGGGLGRSFFRKSLQNLARSDRNYALIAWGVGSDTVIDKTGKALDPDADYDLYSPYFKGFDEVGIRTSTEPQQYRWVPCASCMSPLLDQYRDTKPTKRLGFYQHKHSRLKDTAGLGSVGTNNGNKLEDKLAFLADHEYIVTNTYHGVYWATLLERKVLCLPFKSGLFSYKHKPTYISTDIPQEDEIERAVIHPQSLEECRKANTDYFEYLTSKYGDL